MGPVDRAVRNCQDALATTVFSHRLPPVARRTEMSVCLRVKCGLRVDPSPPMIEVQNLTRVFRTYKKKPGFWGGVRGLFRREFE